MKTGVQKFHNAPKTLDSGWSLSASGGPEWDVVSQTLDERVVLLGEVKWPESPVDIPRLRSLAKALLKKGIPPVKGPREKELCHVVFVPEVTQDTPGEIHGVHVVTGDQVLHPRFLARKNTDPGT